MLLLWRALAVAAALVYGPVAVSSGSAQPKSDTVVWHCSQAASLYRLRCMPAGSSAAEYPLYSATEFSTVRAGLVGEPRAGAIEKADPCRGSVCGGVLDPRVMKYYAGPVVHGSALAEARGFVARFDAWLRINGRCEGGQPVVKRRAARDSSSGVLYIRSCL